MKYSREDLEAQILFNRAQTRIHLFLNYNVDLLARVKSGLDPLNPLRQAMFMDTAEYGYYRTGKDASAFIMSMLTLPTKVGTTLAGTVATAGLAFIGYEAGMEATDQFISSLMNIICFIPVVCGVIAFSLMLFYSLSEDRVAEYMKANKIKRAEAK